MKKIIYLLLVCWGIASCYDDLGNYKYHQINEVTIYGLDSVYNLDQFENLVIQPTLFGEQYSNDDKFEYEWTIGNKVVSEEKNLNYNIITSLGSKTCRYAVIDKVLRTKSFFYFRLNVSNSTAGDGILVLSNYNNKAELSFKRLDKDGGFNINYYERVVGHPLGTGSQALYQTYDQYDVCLGLQVLLNEGLRALEPNTIVEPNQSAFLNEDFFRRISEPYPVPVFTDFHVEGMNHIVKEMSVDQLNLWGGDWRSSSFCMISGGRYYYTYHTDNPALKIQKTILNQSSPYGGRLSSASFWVARESDLGGGDGLVHRGYIVSDYLMMFDETYGQFVYANGNSPLYEINDLYPFLGYKLKYGSYVHLANYCVAILQDGDRIKGLLLKAPRNDVEKKGSEQVPPLPFELKGEVDFTGIMQPGSEFYNMTYTTYMLFSTKDKLYKCNVMDWANGNSAVQELASLARYGYDASAEITCMFMSRSEKNIVLGVSRYGQDVTGGGDELKGDVLVINAKDYSLVKKYEGVCGYPVDIMVKYQFFYRDGKNEFEQDSDPI